MTGSPPHGRGKACGPGLLDVVSGITPAWAGKRPPRQWILYLVGDHPRVGGEKPVAMHNLTTKAGSPPRGRGKELWKRPLSCKDRITPAWAGKRSPAAPPYRRPQDHPRMGGEKRVRSWLACCSQGSPPRGRGKVRALHCSSPVPGITPAWAGKSVCGPRFCRLDRDHPRVGGEKPQG